MLCCLKFLNIFTYFFHIFFSSLYTILLIIFRPYKRVIHSFTELFPQFLWIGCNCFVILYEIMERKVCLRKGATDYTWIVYVCFAYVFLMVASIYCCVWIIRKVKFAVIKLIQQFHPTHEQQPLLSADHITDEEQDDDEHVEFADRLMNPQNYKRE